MTDDTETKGPHVVDIGKRNEMQGAIENARRNISSLIEHTQLQAKIRRASYLALVSEGFTEAQALELCKSA